VQVFELAGVNDILSKSIGSRTPINMVRATFAGLKRIKNSRTSRCTSWCRCIGVGIMKLEITLKKSLIGADQIKLKQHMH
jgi:hypothetical protein